MTKVEEIKQLIASGRFEYSLEKSNQYLREAAVFAQNSVKTSSKNYLFCLLGKEAYKELALNDARPNVRTDLWLKALNALTWCEPLDQHQFAFSYAGLVVDFCQDKFSNYPSSTRHALLIKAKNLINKSIDETKVSEYKAMSLASKSAIIRHQAIGVTAEERLRLLSEAYRCSSLARGLSQHASIIQEYALVEWELARTQNTYKKYVDKLRSVEELLNLDVVRKLDLGSFTLARFYRMTYRYYDACITYPQLTESSTNRRRILRGASIYAESAIQLLNLRYPSVLVEEHIEKAKNLLEIAISSGCKSAREVIALAYIRCLKDGVSNGVTALVDLSSERGDISWEQVLTMLSESMENDLPAEGFALGVTDSSALTRLGTFTNRFLNNLELAEALFRAAVRMNPHNPIAQTNLARFLVRRGEPADLREAKRIIQLAQSFTDRGFLWWRPVLLELNRLENEKVLPSKNESNSTVEQFRPYSGDMRLSQIRKHYNNLKSCKDKQFRGYELERLIYAVSRSSFGFQRPSYRMTRPLVGKIHQIDTYIEHREKSYRCECKWQAVKASYDDIVRLADKIDVVGVSGLFVSMSGFTDSAIKKSKEFRSEKAIILVDGDEVDLVMTGSVRFDDLLNAKRIAFESASDTYFQVSVSLSDG